MLKIKLYPFYEMDGDIGGSPSVEGTAEAVSDGIAPAQESQEAAETSEQTETEGSFAKRLREHSEKAIKTEREKWESEQAEKFKNYDEYRKAAEYLQKSAGISDIMTLKEEIELAELQERAAEENLPPSVLKRMDELEAKAAKFEEFEQQQAQSQEVQEFRAALEPFAKEKGLDADELHKFMFDNQIGNMDIAARAMKAEQLEKQVATAKEDGVKEYLASKQAPRVEGGNGAAGMQQTNTAKMSWEEIDRVAAERLRAANQPT